MLDVFKNCVSTILCIGILFTIIRMIIPNSNLKKYIYSLIGVVTVIVLITPFISLLKNENIEDIKDIILNATNNIDSSNINYTDISNYEDINKNNVKENFKESVENDIKNKLSDKLEKSLDVNVQITDTYNIEKINITIYEDTSFDILSYIIKEYDIDKSKINIQKGG